MNNVEQKAKDFAKQCKISQAKALEFANAILAEAQCKKAGLLFLNPAIKQASQAEKQQRDGLLKMATVQTEKDGGDLE